MSTDLQNLKLRMATLRAEQLLAIVTVDAANYRSDALALARAELHKRGYTELDLQNWGESAGDQPPEHADQQSPKLTFAFTLLLTAFITFSLFAPLIYLSIIAYGIPPTIFIGLGYLIWRWIRQNDPPQARAFAIGFASSVSILLTVVSIEVPWYLAMIVAECLCLWVLFKILWR